MNYVVLDGHKAVFNISESEFQFIKDIKACEAQIAAVEQAKRNYFEERQKLDELLDNFGDRVVNVLDGIKKAIPELIQ